MRDMTGSHPLIGQKVKFGIFQNPFHIQEAYDTSKKIFYLNSCIFGHPEGRGRATPIF